ncbi:MAG: phosphatidate cytidylyltransferase [Clostridia bacterium]|nr:phosphatidate cytidylyltransferase [Clostridia bacterium]
MAKRIISGTVGAVFIIMVVFFSSVYPIIIDIGISAICACSIFEIFAAVNIKRSFYLVVPSVVFSLLLPVSIATPYWWIAFYLYTVALFGIMIWKRDVFKFKDVAVIYGMTIMVTLSLATLSLLSKMDENIAVFFIMFVLVVTWMSDTGAFFIGTAFGKHKLAPTISPKKTVEGALGGVVFALVSGVLISLLFEKVILSPHIYINYIVVTVLSLATSVISILGDLIFSYLKRACNIKDFGNVIPGHGGILDRFDSVIFAAPLIYSCTLIIPWATYIK